MTELLEFECPRCMTTCSENFYGPCDTCRTDLRTLHGFESREIVNDMYEPKMNVIPNQVATRE
ncbi:MAG TPA: hypothetical protein DCP89_01225 [Acidimicrobiaceae bacterium]|nr:hypothetical protein [Actinomycetota bacterium]HAN07095.1 hypothetical protein [Acidimicrobiaceae bacterium]